MARIYTELLDIKEKFSKILFITDYIRCHGLPDSVGKKNGIILFFLSRNMDRQKLKEVSYPVNSVVSTLLATWTISCYCLEWGKNRRKKKQPCNEGTGH